MPTSENIHSLNSTFKLSNTSTGASTTSKQSAPIPQSTAPTPEPDASAPDQFVASAIASAQAGVILGLGNTTPNTALVKSLLAKPAVQQQLTTSVVNAIDSYLATSACAQLINDAIIVAGLTVSYVRQRQSVGNSTSTLKTSTGQVSRPSGQMTQTQALVAALGAYTIVTGSIPSQDLWNDLLATVDPAPTSSNVALLGFWWGGVVPSLVATAIWEIGKYAYNHPMPTLQEMVEQAEQQYEKNLPPQPTISQPPDLPIVEPVTTDGSSVSHDDPPPPPTPNSEGNDVGEGIGSGIVNGIGDGDSDGSSGSTGRRAIDVSAPTQHPD